MASKFDVGDVVKLGSDGPDMSVRLLPKSPTFVYTCQWFAGKKLEQGNFSEDQLQLVKKKP